MCLLKAYVLEPDGSRRLVAEGVLRARSEGGAVRLVDSSMGELRLEGYEIGEVNALGSELVLRPRK